MPATKVAGRELRHVPNRKTKDGSFLGGLAERGLIEVASADPDPFAATYALTPIGERAAEYGEYEGPPPWEAPPAGAIPTRPRRGPGRPRGKR